MVLENQSQPHHQRPVEVQAAHQSCPLTLAERVALVADRTRGRKCFDNQYIDFDFDFDFDFDAIATLLIQDQDF